MRLNKITHRDREMWVANDEGLYNLWRRSRLSLRKFVSDNREIIDTVIANVTSGRKPSHYLAYGS